LRLGGSSAKRSSRSPVEVEEVEEFGEGKLRALGKRAEQAANASSRGAHLSAICLPMGSSSGRMENTAEGGGL